MKRRRGIRFWLVLIPLLLVVGCAGAVAIRLLSGYLPADRPAEAPITPIPLTGPMERDKAEVSGLAWYGDHLIILPQYPRSHYKYPNGGGVATLTRTEILDYLDGKTAGPLKPRPINFNSGNIQKTMRGFEGFEAIAFSGDRVFLLVEASAGLEMRSFLVQGTIAPDLSLITLDEAGMTEIPLDKQQPNFSNEALVVWGDRLYVFYEANGAGVYPRARAYRYTFDFQPDGFVDMPNLPYRLTDATPPDDLGRFWVINSFHPAEARLFTMNDPLARNYGRGDTHSRSLEVERLVELQLPAPGTSEPIVYTGAPPIQIQLANNFIPRNWEGLAILDGRGYLIMSDRYPGTVLAFIPYPDGASSNSNP